MLSVPLWVQGRQCPESLQVVRSWYVVAIVCCGDVCCGDMPGTLALECGDNMKSDRTGSLDSRYTRGGHLLPGGTLRFDQLLCPSELQLPRNRLFSPWNRADVTASILGASGYKEPAPSGSLAPKSSSPAPASTHLKGPRRPSASYGWRPWGLSSTGTFREAVAVFPVRQTPEEPEPRRRHGVRRAGRGRAVRVVLTATTLRRRTAAHPPITLLAASTTTLVMTGTMRSNINGSSMGVLMGAALTFHSRDLVVVQGGRRSSLRPWIDDAVPGADGERRKRGKWPERGERCAPRRWLSH